MKLELKKEPQDYLDAIELIGEFCMENSDPEIGWTPSLYYYLDMMKIEIQRIMSKKITKEN